MKMVCIRIKHNKAMQVIKTPSYKINISNHTIMAASHTLHKELKTVHVSSPLYEG